MATYTIRVVDGDGNPIEGARVVAVGERLDKLTDVEGEVSVTIGSYNKGLGVSLLIEAPGGSPVMGGGPLVLEPGVTKEIVL